MMSRAGSVSARLTHSWLLWVALFMTASGSTPLAAASLEVEASAAFEGDFGLRVTPGCGHPFSLEITAPPVPTLPAEVAACTTIAASGIEIVPPGSLFRAGQKINLGNLFHVGEGALFTAILDYSLLPFAWVRDDSPQAEDSYNASFHIDLDDLTLMPGDRLEQFVGYAANGVPWLRVVLKRSPVLPEDRLVLEARNDNGTWLSTSSANEELIVEPGWNEIQLAWRAAESGQDNGRFGAEIRNLGSGHSYSVELSCQDPSDPCLVNRIGRIDTVRWGAIDGLFYGTSGSLKLDHFVSWK